MIGTDLSTPFRLEDWTVEPEFNRLSHGTSNHHIEPKIMRVLLQLAARPKRVVSKDEILRAVWPDTFVGEDALTRCISVLRHVFGDDPHHPRFVQTIPKVGYCLLVEAVPFTAPSAGAQPAKDVVLNDEMQRPPASPLAVARPHANAERVRRRWSSAAHIAMAALAVATVCVLTVLAVHTLRANSVQPSFRTMQLTMDAGEQSRPALSPDGKRLAFV